jgi:hypothetical protein
MTKLARFSIPGLLFSLTLLVPMHAQAAEKKVQSSTGATTASSTASSPSPADSDTASQAPANPAAASPVPDQAPDEATKKISELVHAGKYAEAQQLTAGLLIAYPNDQRLIRAKALIEQLIAQASSPAGAAPASAAPAQPAATGELTGMDKVDYNALIDLVRQAQQTTDLTEQTRLLNQFMDQSSTFLQQHPDQMLLWQLRAASAITLNQPLDGYEAGQRLLAGDAAESNDPGLLNLLGQLKNKGWLDKQQAETLQVSADEDRRQQEAAADAEQKKEESAKYTFPVVHVHGISYGYGHLTINEDEAIYVGTDETDHIARSDVETLKVTCNADSCGFYIIPKNGRKYFILPVTEDAVTNQTDKGKIYLKPSVLGNAFMARWHFVPSADNKSLNPPPPGTDTPQAPSSAAPRGGYSSNSVTIAAPPSALASAFLSNAGSEPTTAAPSPAPSPPPSSATQDLIAGSAPSNSVSVSAPAAAVVDAAPGMAVLHVYRIHQMTGMGTKADVEVDGRSVAKVANAEVVRVEVPAGKHNISVVDKHVKTDQPLYDFDMEAGKEYWVHAEFSSGLLVHLKLYAVTAEQAAADVKPLKDGGDDSSKKR